MGDGCQANRYHRYQPKLSLVTAPLHPPLSAKTKQAFQALGVVSTVLVVAIHYRSAAPTGSSPLDATWNELLQEFLLGGLSRIAVPLFAFAAGLFYFASCDGTISSHLNKWRSRVSTLLVPYLIAGGVAVSVSTIVGYLQNDEHHGLDRLLVQWWLRPPAEQLWFLRDLVMLTTLAPLIGVLVVRAGTAAIAGLAALWLMNIQPFPIVNGWYLINIETLFFYAMGVCAARHPRMIEALVDSNPLATRSLLAVWFLLVAARICVQPNFDAWYVTDYTMHSLLLHQVSILVGLAACVGWAGGCTSPAWPKLSGLSFFVYLVHEFPLRAVVVRFVEMTSLDDNSLWIAAPLATVACFLGGWWLNHRLPTWFSRLTGGRTPTRAMRLRNETNMPGTTMGATA